MESKAEFYSEPFKTLNIEDSPNGYTQPFLKVPIELIQYSIKNGHLPELRLFLMLKFNGHTIQNTKAKATWIAEKLGYKSHKTVAKLLQRLTENMWLNFDSCTNLLFVQGFGDLNQKLKLGGKAAAYIHLDDLTVKKQFSAFAIGAVLTSLCNTKRNGLKRLGHKRERSKEDRTNPYGYFPISNQVIMRLCNCSLGQAHNLKQLARTFGYIDKKSAFQQTDYAASDLQRFIRGHPEFHGKITIRDGKIAVRKPDLIKGYVKISSRGKKMKYK